MPFMIGSSPVRRTLPYLKKCKIYFRDEVRIFSVSYNKVLEHHAGAREFVFWHLQQIQFNNPTVQCITFENLTPTPFIQIYTENNDPLLIDLDSRKKDEIEDHLAKLRQICLGSEEITALSITEEEDKMTYFGFGCERHCLCEVPGQVPCPQIVKVPDEWKGTVPKQSKVIIPPYIRKWWLDQKLNQKRNRFHK